jgi:hypothetical protein
MYILYADEFGHDGVYDPADPIRRHHPLFGLAGFALRSHRWRDIDRRYLRLKQRFYPREIAREGVRPERFEPKDLDLRSRRDKQFTHAVFTLLEALGAVVFAYGLKKPVAAAHDSRALYGSVTQGLMRACEKFVRDRAGEHTKAMMVIDRRQEARDVELLESAQSYLFSAARDIPRGFDRLIEVPLLVRSEWHHGIQIADNLCRVIGRAFRYRADPAGEAKWQPFDKEFGPKVDALTHRIDPAWRSVYVRS